MKQLTTDIGEWTREEFISYLRETLIPDLKESGSEGHVHDYELAIRFMEDEDRQSGPFSDLHQEIYGFASSPEGKSCIIKNHPLGECFWCGCEANSKMKDQGEGDKCAGKWICDGCLESSGLEVQ